LGDRVNPIRSIVHAARIFAWRRNHSDFAAVFNWHQVSPDFEPGRHHRYIWTGFEVFRQAVDWIAQEFEVVPLYELIARLRAGKVHGALAALTFDDGDASVANYVLPLLASRGVPATFFINSAYIEQPRTYWFPVLAYLENDADARARAGLADVPEALSRRIRTTSDPTVYNFLRERVENLASSVPHLQERVVTRDWLARLDPAQFSIGAHGHEHQRFSMMSPDWQSHDLKRNLDELGSYPAFRPIFAIPFGRSSDWNVDTVRIARSLGLDVVFAAGGLNRPRSNELRRIPSDGADLRPLLRTTILNEARIEREARREARATQ
jgi:peptidoglycan/xylan/chitin deacetylase (PgdA/CDA1 family)